SSQEVVAVLPEQLPSPHPLVAGIQAGLRNKPSAAISAQEKPQDTDETGAELRMFVGYLGVVATFDPWPDKWIRFFLDETFERWLLVRVADIAFVDVRNYDRAPVGRYDCIWVRREAPIGPGGPKTNPADLFLTGGFTAAGEFATSVRGDTN